MVTNVVYPSKAFINAITSEKNALVTFTADHDFSLGEIVSFRVGFLFGMFQINNRHGMVLEVTSDTIRVDIDTTFWDAFDYSSLNASGSTPPTCVPAGSGIIPASMPSKVNIQDAFDMRRSS
jgi:hypothetical protein